MNNDKARSEARFIQGLVSWVLCVSQGMDIECGIRERMPWKGRAHTFISIRYRRSMPADHGTTAMTDRGQCKLNRSNSESRAPSLRERYPRLNPKVRCPRGFLRRCGLNDCPDPVLTSLGTGACDLRPAFDIIV